MASIGRRWYSLCVTADLDDAVKLSLEAYGDEAVLFGRAITSSL